MATVDVRDLNTVRWGPLRAMFPSFVHEVELGRYLKRLLRECACTAVQVQPHRKPDGTASDHVFDIFSLNQPT
jgi:hypothetical protein